MSNCRSLLFEYGIRDTSRYITRAVVVVVVIIVVVVLVIVVVVVAVAVNF